ncbi:MAG: hypothetical protein Q9202_001535 [Teloschistes flavicans]
MRGCVFRPVIYSSYENAPIRCQQALDLGKEPLNAAINAASQSPNSHGFHAFFKSDASTGPVVDMLKKVQTMKAIRGLKPNRFILSQPEFVCVDGNTHSRYPRLPRDPYQTCRLLGVFGLWIRGFKYIFLCPKIFTLPISPRARHCPRVIDNQFERKGYLLADYQKYILIHEMIHFYLGRSSLGWESKPLELYELNECVNFDAKNSLRNPMNYQYYIAMVEQGCNEAPNPSAPPFPLGPQALTVDENDLGHSGPIDVS